jgi:hypothetical protein
VNLSDVYAKHQELNRNLVDADDPVVHALGAFKAVRNFLHPLLRSRHEPGIGIDHRPAAVEALGDCVMYLCSLRRSMDLGPPEHRIKAYAVSTAEEAAEKLIWNFALIARCVFDPAYSNVPGLRKKRVDEVACAALAAVQTACNVCLIDFDKVVEKSLAKLLVKFAKQESI